jgi:hypothetical protein
MAARTTDTHPTIAWMAWLFGVGSTCFLVAALASQWASTPRAAIGITFFAGSLCFTSAAYLQHWLSVRSAPPWRRGMHWSVLRPAQWPGRHVDVLASFIQLVGTIFFNVNTFEGMQEGLTATQQDLRIWTPDVIGSICFLVSSQLAFSLICRRWVAFGPRTRDWWIAFVNLLGSIAFGASAVAALVDPSTGDPVSAHIANGATAAGALGFLIGSVLLYPRGDTDTGAQVSTAARRQPSG